MGLTSLQVCMDSSDWLQGTIHDESGMEMDSSSSPSGADMLTCSRPLMERRLRPPHDQALKCPRCDSTHTKFCYYNNYSLTQPRYFCKTCRRYWTKGGTLRNIPVGGGCRKNKKVSTKKSNNNNNNNPQNTPGSSSHSHPHPHHHLHHHHHDNDNDNHNPTELQLSFPDMQFSHLSNILGGAHLGGGGGGGSGHYNSMIDQTHRPIDFMERKLEAIVGNSRSNYDFMGGNTNYNSMLINGGSDLVVDNHLGGGGGSVDNFHGFCSPFGASLLDHGNGGNLIDACQRLMLPFDGLNHHPHVEQGEIDVKPTTKLLSLDWQQDQNCPTSGKDTFAYLNSMGSWSNNSMINGYGSSTSTANPLL